MLLRLLPVLALCFLASACGGAPRPGASTQPTRQSQALAFSRCMRDHGVPSFPDPDSDGNYPTFSTNVEKRVSAAASDTCRHLLARGGTATPRQREQKLAFGLKVAQCLRKHGYPSFPDPGSSGQRVPPAINIDSPQFQSSETACEQSARKALGLP